jgi:hypothetical protein
LEPDISPERQLQLRLIQIADELDRNPGEVDQDRIAAALQEFEDLGVADLMTPAESTRVSLENLPNMLEDGAGIAALIEALALGARLIETLSTSDTRDWWGGTDPEVLLANDPRIPGTELFYSFGAELIRELQMSRNLLAVPAPDVDHFDQDALWPPVFSVVTSNSEFREWTFGWGGQLIWWAPTPTGFRLELQSVLGTEEGAEFHSDQIESAAQCVAEWIAEPPANGSGSYVTVNEHRALEVVILYAQEELERLEVSPEDRLQTQLLIEILQLQLRAPEPDRTIIGRALKGVATFAGGVLTGVASVYLVSLLVKFGVPPP